MLDFLQQYGAWGLFIGSFLASTIVPFSSDALFWGMLLAGVNPWHCFFFALVGNWLGGLTSFALGWIGKWEWIEKWFHVKQETLEEWQHRIEYWGALLAFMTWLPLIGDVFAIGLGFYKLPPVKCAIYMLIGRATRFLLWMVLFEWFDIRIVL